jgi:hypothetical protein
MNQEQPIADFEAHSSMRKVAGYRSSPDREILLVKWHQGIVPTTWATGPFLAAIVECSISGRMRFSAGFVESERIYPWRLVEQFVTDLPGK